MVNLFEEVTQERAPGFRLYRLEVYNWGTFDGAVWPLVLDGDTTLLTGEIGTGKSTMVDALLTLLVPARKVTYNKAADSSARERSLTSYVRGYYTKRVTEQGIEEPKALREKDEYSVILAVFRDEADGSTVTLAQVFWFQQNTSVPERFYVAARRAMSIRGDFSMEGRASMAELRKSLSKENGVKVFNSFNDYFSYFRIFFGITQIQAMELFQQIVSMKKVDGITDFVRNNMLDAVSYRDEIRDKIEQMLKSFHDLERTHDAILRAQKEQEILTPLIADGEAYLAADAQKEAYNAMGSMLEPWMASLEMEDLLRMKDELTREEADRAARLSVLAAEKEKNEESLERARQERYEKGGQKIEIAQQALEGLRKDQRLIEMRRDAYGKAAAAAGLPVPDKAGVFGDNRKRAASMAKKEGEREARLEERWISIKTKENQCQAELAEEKKELLSLQSRRSNIPMALVNIRSSLASDLGLAPGAMPFAGELMEVRPEESAWEGALERLLGEFGTSLLVHETYYRDVIDWMEAHHLGRRFVYYKVEDYTEPAEGEEDPGRACGKIHLKEDSPYCSWLSRELHTRFDHVCCESMEEFRKERFALTKAGQIKTQGRRHMKDDRRRIDDRLHYVLGFSNEDKIRAMMEDIAARTKALSAMEAEAVRIGTDRNGARKKKEAAQRILSEWHDFLELDLSPVAEKIRYQEGLIQDLKHNNRDYRRLEREIDRLKGEGGKIEERIREEEGKRRDAARTASDIAQQQALDEKELARCPEDRKRLYFPMLEDFRKEKKPWTDKSRVTMKSRREKQLAFRDKLDAAKKENDSRWQDLFQRLSNHMNGYSNFLLTQNEENANLSHDMTRANLNEYKKILEEIVKNDLPRLLPRFQEEIREKSIRGMAMFYSNLERLSSHIEERIGEINESLQGIDYNENTYIRIESKLTDNEEIKQFRNDLRRAINTTIGGDEKDYNERKFHEIEKILHRFDMNRRGHTEADSRWTERVTDVRNWYFFAVSERERTADGSLGAEKEHYTDSSGKSGGQKEKLAYTILAAGFMYSFGIDDGKRASFRFAAIDEAFLKSSDESARFSLELFKRLGIQLLLVTPLAKIPTIEPYVGHVGFVSQHGERSEIQNMTIREYRERAEQVKEAGHA